MQIFVISFAPMILILSGVLLWKVPPKSRNYIYGFRTRLASRSNDTWKYANDRSAKLLMLVGVLSLLFGLVAYVFSYFVLSVQFSDDFWGIFSTAVLLLGLLAVIVIVQFELKTKFDNKGKRSKRDDEE